ncbi:MAG: primosomal protein N' [Mycetocola reblochoni]|uniref:Probable replication restart protein PriA n=2 Tax=Mycetocola reblochoni TaxID=331618 RepID=A0A1R4J446_9MICO|nr:primosomal protein N' [Mycetocola reblochoni]SJN26812.1 Helicase PriA essential for oriC/DnaA-independent DNA replication [Mycetocola reblochoni REB411]
MPASVARVVIDSPLPQLDRLLDYRIPDDMAGVRPGVRVRVPLRTGGRIASGYVVDCVDSSDFSGTLAPIEQLVSSAPVLAPEVWRLARAVADRQAGTASDVLRLAIPKRQVRVEKAWLSERAAVGGVGDDPTGAATGPEPRATTPTAGGAGADDSAAPVTDGADVDVPPEGAATADHAELMAAVRAGQRLAVSCTPVVEQTATGEWVGSWALTLAAAAAAVHADGRSALIAVPDHRDLDVLATALAATPAADHVVRLDAAQSGPERYRAFLATLEGRPLVIIGNRSVLYAAAVDPGLIAVWDDGDPLHREPLAPGAHARDVALLRQRQQGAALLFAHHTPSVDTQRLVELRFLRALRSGPDRRARVVVGDGAGDEHRGQRIPPSAWRRARAAIETGPVLLQVARPGYAPGLACGDCGAPARCTVCAGPLQLSSTESTPSCAWCGALATDWHCPHCSGTHIRMSSRGTVRTAEELGRAFPRTRVYVSDGERPLPRLGDAPALVVATRGAEPLVDGGYRAVLLLDGERMLQAESLRIAEDAMRWWSNAAALAAPDGEVVLVGVGGRLAAAFATGAGDRFAAAELADRAELHFPPAVRALTISGDAAPVERAVEALPPLPSGAVLGPMPDIEGMRVIVRFPYGAGDELAAVLKAALIREATARRPAVPGTERARARPKLRVRFDDPDVVA